MLRITLKKVVPEIHRAAVFARSAIVLLLLMVTLPRIASADVVTDWNAIITDLVAPRFGGPQPQARVRAIAQIAVHDALNAISSRYERYTSIGPAAPGASPDAAVAAAARDTLLELLARLPDSPAKQAAIQAIEAAYTATVGTAPYDPATQAGIDIGVEAAAAILALRANDGSDTPNLPYTLLPGPGVYQPTPNPEFPAVVTPSFAGLAYMTPFVIRHHEQFGVEPGEIFNLQGDLYTRQYNEVKQLGDARVRGSQPDSEESDIARFWPGGALEWNTNTRLIVARKSLDRWQHARLFALLNVSVADSMINNLESKYFYNFWRPVTAIRWANDGNPQTASDPNWRPFLQTPPYPDYPCASTSVTGAAAGTLRRFFGTNALNFTRTVTAPPLPLPAPLTELPAKTITRHYASLTHAENEQAMARVFAGIHFIEGCHAGLRAGNQVADWVYARYLRPL